MTEISVQISKTTPNITGLKYHIKRYRLRTDWIKKPDHQQRYHPFTVKELERWIQSKCN